MYFNGNITFKGITSGSLGVIVSSMPKMQHSTVKATEYDIPLRDGIQYSSWRNRTDAQITVKFAIVKDNNTNYIQTLRATRQWLEGTGQLILDNNPDVYYNVKKVEITDEEMYTLSSGELEATFVVEPFEYMRTDTEIEVEIGNDEDGHFIESRTVTINNEADLCKPLIVTTPFIYGALYVEAKFGAKIQIDSNTEARIEYMSGIGDAVTKVAYCDTNLMYTYIVQDGIASNAESKFITHNYDDLWVPHGNHDIKLTCVGDISVTTKVLIKLRKGYAI